MKVFNLPQGTEGPQGIQGPAGLDSTVVGPQGPQGIQGEVGNTGPVGTESTVPGPQGLQGDHGIQGNSGPPGSDGAAGADSTVPGPQGLQGLQGIQGLTGAAGENSTVPGPPGAQGIQGPQGIQGIIGQTGIEGQQGPSGQGFQVTKTYSSVAALNADTSPTGILAGEFAIIDTGDVSNAENSRLYLWNGTAYNFIVDVSGAPGMQGLQGPIGLTGDQGSQGIQGETGAAGPQGIEGVGSAGPQGSQGDPGPQGIQGLTGNTGATGAAGADGADAEISGHLTADSYSTTAGVKYQANNIANADGTAFHASFVDGGSTILHYDGNSRVTTGAGGVNVSGSIAASGAINAGTAVNLINTDSSASISARCATASYKLQAVGANLTILYLQDSAGINGRTAILAKREGRVALYYDNVAKFETTDTGAKVTGVLEGTGAPTAAGHLTRKDYVDSEVADYLPLAGGTLTGNVSSSVAPTSADHLTRKDYVDTAVAAVTSGGTVVPVMLECLYRAPLLVPGNAAHNGIHKVAYSSPSVGGTPSWFTLSSDGYTITLSEDGIYELSHNTFIASTSGTRSSVSARFALGGVVQSIRPATGYVRLSANHNESSTHIVNYLIERSGSNLVLTVPLGNETSNGAVNATMAAGESTLTIKKIT